MKTTEEVQKVLNVRVTKLLLLAEKPALLYQTLQLQEVQLLVLERGVKGLRAPLEYPSQPGEHTTLATINPEPAHPEHSLSSDQALAEVQAHHHRVERTPHPPTTALVGYQPPQVVQPHGREGRQYRQDLRVPGHREIPAELTPLQERKAHRQAQEVMVATRVQEHEAGRKWLYTTGGEYHHS